MSIATTTAKDKGTGCGTVVRVVASDITGLCFESSHRQLLFNNHL